MSETTIIKNALAKRVKDLLDELVDDIVMIDTDDKETMENQLDGIFRKAKDARLMMESFDFMANHED